MNTVTYQWSVSSANAFETWDYNAPGDGTPNQLVPLKSSDADCTGKTKSFTFYDAVNQDAVSVTCTATFTYTDGTPGTVSVTSPAVTFIQPTATWLVNQWASHKAKFISNDVSTNPSFAVSVYWTGITVTIPPPFTTIYGSDLGNACFTQIGQFVRTNTASSQSTTWQNLYVTGGSPPAQYLAYGPTALDGPTNANPAFNYPYVFAADGNGNFTNTNPDGTPTPINNGQTNQGQWPVGQAVIAADQPTQVDSPAGWPDASASNVFWDTATATDTFNTWLMYMPPGANSVWVPLQRLGWAWSGSASNVYSARTNPNGMWLSHGADPPVSHGSPTTDPPAWSAIIDVPLATHP